MQLKGLVKFFTAALILISLYQLSFTFLVQGVEKKAHAQAERQARAANPSASTADLQRLVEARYNDITDSLQGEKVVSLLGIKKYTYAEAKSNELNLGLDLQGGMNVTLDVSLADLVRSMSNNPQDPALNAALSKAEARKASSQADFVTLFGEEFTKAAPSAKMAYLFTKPSQEKITLQSTNDQVLTQIRTEAKGAVQRTFKVLQTRIDKFGVAQPSINLDENKDIITVELAGVRNPERVRNYLQSTANLEFYETYTNQEILSKYETAEKALAAYLSGTEATPATAGSGIDTVVAGDTTVVVKNDADTGSLGALVGSTGKPGDTSKANAGKNPLQQVWLLSEDLLRGNSPVVGLVMKKDTATLSRYLALDVVRNQFPANVKFVYGSENRAERNNPNIPLRLYALQQAPGGGAQLEGNHVVDARQDFNTMNGEPEVSMSMDFTGAQIWKKMTGSNIGQFVAVVLDDRVYSSPIVNGEIGGGSTSISGSFSLEDATDLANILKTGKLPAPARIVQEQVVGPTLGAENIASGIASLGIAFAIIFILMLVYYNTGGIVANIALILNVFFTIAILSMFGATLTMPGIAGLVLTIGMAVDTNVIVFERIKEELTAGHSYQEAIRRGYTRSYAPVLDGHITQFITALILFIFGLGPVRGFATTQMLGLILSVFCGLLVSRLITDMYTNRNRHLNYFTGLSKSIFRKAHFNFIGARKITYIISGIVLLAGIGALVNGFDYGVEFAGGRSYTVRFTQPHTVSDVREKLDKYLGERPIVKTIGTANEMNITTTYLINEQGQEATGKAAARLHEGLQKEGLIPATVTLDDFRRTYVVNEQTVLPTISDDLKKGALQATLLSLAAIFLYILLRFRKWQYSLGTIVSLLHDVCITLAVFSFLRGVVPFALEIDQHFIAAILTVIGFSMNDTVIVFDRVREYFRKHPGEDKKTIINRAINDTLSRTVMTSATVFLAVLVLFIFGGEATRGFAFAMLIGVVIGTYSSIFVAAPILVDLDKGDSLKREVDTEARVAELKKLA
ncbi:MAG: protein translocase subunit SecDF [Sphingobacteriales bacterium]|nr:MAG: protein translocase subunit SecDF [Sphingobacteriales bacterium]